MNKKPKAVIVGGSVAGLSCAHTLILAGWDVVVLDKSPAAPVRHLTGAGIALAPLSLKLIASWLPNPDLLLRATLPLAVDQNQVIDETKKVSRILTRDENYNSRAVHWADLIALLRNALPKKIFLWGHFFFSLCVSNDKKLVTVIAKLLETHEIVEIVADLVFAADGSLSSVRKTFLPDLKLRYAGYCALRGVFDFSASEDSETVMGIRKAYPELGKTLYFDLGHQTHSILFELPNKRLNWVWFINQPLPQLKGNSLTMKLSNDMINNFHKKADQTWVPELAKLIKQTKQPFLNVLYDHDPLDRIYYNNVVLVGDAAHPTTPHGARSTNMSVLDAMVLGKCLEKFGANELHRALEEYQSIRLPVILKQVLYSRKMGRIKQGWIADGREGFDPSKACEEDCEELRQDSMPFFHHVPSFDGSS